MKKDNLKIFPLTLICILSVLTLFTDIDSANAASRGGRGAPVAAAGTRRASIAKTSTESEINEVKEEAVETIVESVSSYDEDEDEEETQIINKSSQFAGALSSSSSSDKSKSDLAEKIRKQREALDARDNAAAFEASQKSAMKSGKNACDTGLRDCMTKKCGNDFSKCALDGDTIFGDKLNLCRKDISCTGEEFRLFTTEIKADRDLNAQLSSYTKVVECGNKYNDCMQKECGTTFNKCLGKPFADRAAKNCETIAKNCMEQDSGLSARFGTAIGKLRETAEKEVKEDEARMYKLRDDMRDQCQHLGAMFDERSFDCVYTVNFFAGDDQQTPKASRKAYAGNTFVCMQEWFGINVTTYKENAYRETRAQSAASSAMLGSGVGTAAGLISSGAIGRALDTQKAKKDLKNECKAQGGIMKNGECHSIKTAVEKVEQKAKEAKDKVISSVEEAADDTQRVSKAVDKGAAAVNDVALKPLEAAEQTTGQVKDVVDNVSGMAGNLGNGTKTLADNVVDVMGAVKGNTSALSIQRDIIKEQNKQGAQITTSDGQLKPTNIGLDVNPVNAADKLQGLSSMFGR